MNGVLFSKTPTSQYSGPSPPRLRQRCRLSSRSATERPSSCLNRSSAQGRRPEQFRRYAPGTALGIPDAAGPGRRGPGGERSRARWLCRSRTGRFPIPMVARQNPERPTSALTRRSRAGYPLGNPRPNADGDRHHSKSLRRSIDG